MNHSDRAELVVRKMSRTPFVPTVDVRTGLPPLENSYSPGLFPTERWNCTAGIGSENVDIRYPAYIGAATSDMGAAVPGGMRERKIEAIVEKSIFVISGFSFVTSGRKRKLPSQSAEYKKDRECWHTSFLYTNYFSSGNYPTAPYPNPKIERCNLSRFLESWRCGVFPFS